MADSKYLDETNNRYQPTDLNKFQDTDQRTNSFKDMWRPRLLVRVNFKQ